ncbi:MAG: TetR/AcrR family transcriptional regulator [Caulobacteraceae bacterium]|nr:TetR/AcrR family transcriptional regulator [Caulobacteraceae bacterium]
MPEGGMQGVRKQQKEATRQRVVSAARELFEGVGYEETTIRMIAERAGVSVGSVFTTFESKVDIFNHILFQKFELLFGELQRIAPHLKGSCCDRIVSLMSIAYGVECRQLDLMISHLAASHGWPDRIEAENARRHERLVGLFRDCLDHGVRAGELRADADLDLFLETLMAVYLRNYRKAYYERLGAEAMSELIEKQVKLIFEGLRA